MSLRDGYLTGVFTDSVSNRRATDTAYLTASAASLLAASSTTGSILITGITLCNTHSSALTVTLYRHVSGDTAGASGAKTILSAHSLATNETLDWEPPGGGLLLQDEGDYIAGKAGTTNLVTITITYIIQNA